jgi:hypothetical protein
VPYNEGMAWPDPISSLISISLRDRPLSVVSQLVLKVQPLASTPTSSERIAAQNEAIRHQGFSTYA